MTDAATPTRKTTSPATEQGATRRQFLSNTGKAAAATTLAGMAVPNVHGYQSSTIGVALIGCGGRGTGAASNALGLRNHPMKLVAMADVFDHRLRASHNNLERSNPASRFDVPKERQFIGFDGYQKAMDCLKPGDIAIFTTPLAFRWVHFAYAIKKGLNVFMEKPLTADGPTSRRMLELGKQASAKGLKVGVGLMSRHQRGLEQLAERIHGGEIGDIVTMRGYRMAGGNLASFRSHKWPGLGKDKNFQPSELLWQISRFHSFIWASGGCFNDYYIHIVDHLCWMKNAWPVKAQSVGGRHWRDDYVDQNFDSYGVEYTFEDGAKLFFDGRCMDGAEPIYSSYVHGSKGLAIASAAGDCGLPSSIYKGQNPTNDNKLWESKVPVSERNPYDNEWADLVDAITKDKPFNETERGVYASLTCSLGRFAAHTGREVTMDQVLNDKREYAPDCDKWTTDSPPPVRSNDDGRYPVPQPGKLVDREW